MIFESSIMCFDDHESKVIHVMSEDKPHAVCGETPNEDIMKWPAQDTDELDQMVNSGFNYSLCNRCQYNHISEFE